MFASHLAAIAPLRVAVLLAVSILVFPVAHPVYAAQQPWGYIATAARLPAKFEFTPRSSRWMSVYPAQSVEEPITFTSAGVPQAIGISGRVTANGLPAAHLPLSLQMYDEHSETTVQSTITTSNGDYLFANAPGLPAGRQYYVRFGPNSSDPSRVAAWYGPDITSYNSGQSVSGGDFDIADIPLQAPPHNANTHLPTSFSWVRRSVPTDSYRLYLMEPDFSAGWMTELLGFVSGIILPELPIDASYNHPYTWFVAAYQAPDSFGFSFWSRYLTFITASSTSTPIPTHTRTPTTLPSVPPATSAPTAQVRVYMPIVLHGSTPHATATPVVTTPPTATSPKPTATPTSTSTLVTPTPTPPTTAMPTRTPIPVTPAWGKWAGSTSRGHSVSFQVWDGGSGWVFGYFGLETDMAGCPYSIVPIPVPDVGFIQNGRFSYKGTTFSFSGQFGSNVTSAGTYAFEHYDAGPCGFLTQAGSWTANYCTGGICQ